MSSLTLQEIAQFSLNLLEQRLEPAEPKIETFTETYLGRATRTRTVETLEDGLELWTYREIERPTPRIIMIVNGPATSPRRRRITSNGLPQSPLVLMEHRRRLRLSFDRNPSRIPSWVPTWQEPESPSRRKADLPKSRVGWKGDVPPRTPSGIKLRLRFRKRELRATRAQEVTEFFALDSKGNPAKLT